jgi:hypothetical protein
VARLAFLRLISADRRGELRRIAAQEPGPDSPAAGLAPGVKRFDKFVPATTIVGFLSFYALAGLDARYGWSQLSAA